MLATDDGDPLYLGLAAALALEAGDSSMARDR
jgi:hypothetical protein